MKEKIYDSEDGAIPIWGELEMSAEGQPCVRLEGGCNEFWLDLDEARAVIAYLQRMLPVLIMEQPDPPGAG